jgi:formylglycine-generating enzyme required for sulfatase activity
VDNVKVQAVPAPSTVVLAGLSLVGFGTYRWRKWNRLFASLCLCCTITLFASPASAVTIAWSPVGNPGNAADPTTGLGSVGYSYNIGTYDVTNSQYVEFLNAKDPTGANPHALYNSGTTGTPNSGIKYTAGNASGRKYSVISGTGNHPVVDVTWYDAIRFANWLNNGQGNGDTESGAYTLLGGTPTPSNAVSITRNPGAKVFVPSESEWYKAAYYNSATSSYFQYPTNSDTVPVAESPPGGSNSANLPGSMNPLELTDVGAYTGTMSPYGAFDMAGDVFQWNEAFYHIVFGLLYDWRGVRGASFHDFLYTGDLLPSALGFEDPAVLNGGEYGFRLASVASVPEPSAGVLALFACGLLCWRRKWFR